MNNRYDNYRGNRRSQYGDYDELGRQSHQWDQTGDQQGESYTDSDRRERSSGFDAGRSANWDRDERQHQNYRGTSYGDGFGAGAGSAQSYERYQRSDDRYGADRFDRPGGRQSYQRDYRQSGDYGHDRNDQGNRGFFDRAGDEIASWFGDDEATRRREADHRGSGPQNYARSDERILDDVCNHLTEDRYVDARNVTVTVQDREVTLDGTVNSKAAKRRAEDCADAVSGVRHVQNNLRVSDRYETDTSQTVLPKI